MLRLLLLPFSWLYGCVVVIRNWLFDTNVLKSRLFDVPVICVGNITVGGCGKTPHVEYLLRLLSPSYKLAVLSRGYKRKSKGFVLADAGTPMPMIGDEPWQMKHKFANVHVAVCADRCEGIRRILADRTSADTQVVILDDAFQHRYVKPGLAIVLVDYNRFVTDDCLLPAGRLREPCCGLNRADVIVVTKCPAGLNHQDAERLRSELPLAKGQPVFFSSIAYLPMQRLWGEGQLPLDHLPAGTSVLVLSAIATPEVLRQKVAEHAARVEMMSFADHHQFTAADVERINDTYQQMLEPKVVVTTEKDAARLRCVERLTDDVRHSTYVLAITVGIKFGAETEFNNIVKEYVNK